MAEPVFQSDEELLVRTPGVTVKSIPFEGILTSRRVILVDRAKNILPPKEIPLATIKSVEPGVNAHSEPTLNLSIMAKTGETRQMILAFSLFQDGGDRFAERDEWIRYIRETSSPSFEQVIRKVIPAAEQVQRTAAPAVQPMEDAPKVTLRRASDVHPSRKIIEADTPPAAADGETVFCNRCGNRVPAESAFCNRCGATLAASAAAADSPRTPPPQQATAAAPAFEQPASPAPYQVPDSPALQSPGWDEGPAPESRPSSARPARKDAKPGLLAGIFGSKKAKETPAAPAPAAPRPPREGRSSLPGKKILLAAGAVILVILILAAGVLFVLPMLTSGSPSSPASSGSTGGSSTPAPSTTKLTAENIVIKETTRPTIPLSGVYVYVSYIGSWKGTYGMASEMQTAVDSGDKYYEVVNASGLVSANFEKKDSSKKHDLTVYIYKDGKEIATGTTSDAYGKVTVSADVAGGVAANATLVATTTVPSGNATATTKVTTTKTTAPSVTATTTSTK